MKVAAVVLLGVVVIFMGFAANEVRLQRRAVPPGDLSDFDGFLDWKPDAWRFAFVDVDGARYLHAYGEPEAVLVEGPPIYVFDECGRLQDWTTDAGDDVQFQGDWPDVTESEFVNREAVLQWLAACVDRE